MTAGSGRTGPLAAPTGTRLLAEVADAVRIVELSNHPEAMLRQTRQRRASADRQAQSEYDNALARHRARVQRARKARDKARAQRRWLTWLRCALAVRREQRQVPAPPGPAGGVSDQEEILAAGITGEQLIAAGLGQVLGDDWTLLRGYRNNRGEIDHLLLGPQGIIAIEGKYLNATVHCVGDNWRSEKYDRYGNLVEQGTISDKTGRSPSVQLNEPAAILEDFLRSRGHRLAVRRVVLLTHPRSKIGNCRNPTVRIGISTDYVISLLNSSPPALDAAELMQLEQLIVRDHRFHESRRRTASPRHRR